MSTEFGINIMVSPGAAKSTIDNLTGSLDKLEAAGPRAGAAASKGIAELTAAAKASVPAIAAMTAEEKAFESMVVAGNAALTQEKSVLEQVLGPQKKHAEMLETLDRLYAKDKITIQEWTDAVTKANQALARTQPRSNAGFDSTSGTQFGPTFDPTRAGATSGAVGGGGLSGILGAVGVGVGISTITAGLKSLRDMSDAYTELENRVRKFADASGGVSETLTQQRELSVAIRADLGETIGLYDRVTQSTRNLYLTQKQQLEITQSLGLMAKEANVPLSEAEGIMKKFTIAADTGTFTMRMFRDLGMNMPQMLQSLADHFGVTIKQFEQLAVKGQIAPRDIALAISESLPGAQAKIESYGKTSKERFKEATFAMIEMGDAHKRWANSLNESFGPQMKLIEQFNEINNTAHLVADTVAQMNESFAKTKEAIAGMFSDQLRQDLNSYTNGVGAMEVKLAGLLAEQAKFASMPSMGATDAGFANQLSDKIAKVKAELLVAQNSGSEATLKQMEANQKYAAEVERLTNDEHNAALGADGMRAAHEALAEAMKKHERHLKTGGAAVSEFDRIYKSLYETLRKGQIESGIAEQAASAIFASGLSTMAEYVEMLEKIRAAREKAQKVPSFVDSHGSDFSLGQSADQSQANDMLGGALTKQGVLQPLIADQERLKAIFAGSAEAAQRYNLEIENLDKSLQGLTPESEDYARALDKIREKYDTTRDPEEIYNDKLKETKALYEAMKAPAEDLDRALQKLREQFGKGTFTDGLQSAMSSLKKQSEDSKLAIDLTNAAINGMSKGLENLVQHQGSLKEWAGAFLDSLAQIIEKALITKAVMSLLGLGGGAGGGAGGVAGEIVDAVTSTPGPVTTPGYANGTSWTQPGSGTDNVPFMARLTPGEGLTVHTQQDMARMRSGDGGGTRQQPIIVNVHNNPDRRALQPPPTRGEVHVMIQDALRRR